jgi:hypothetical protein
MKKTVFRLFLLVCLISSLFFQLAFAYGRYHWHGGGWHRWYGPSSFGVYMAAPNPTIGVVVDTLPPGYAIVTSGGYPYYYYMNNYYRPYQDGYIVVAPPQQSAADQAVAPAQTPTVQAEDQTPVSQGNISPYVPVTTPKITEVTLNVPNVKGGFTPVKLKKFKNGYIGPQGEFYLGNPTVEQLKVLYGK